MTAPHPKLESFTAARVPLYAPLVYTFVPFALLVTAGNAQAELAANLDYARVVYTVLISAVFAIPAAAIFLHRDLRTAPPLMFRYWQLCWTFGFIAFALHMYWSVGVWFEWDFAQIWRRQTGLVAISNYLLFGLWGSDVFFAIFYPRRDALLLRILHWSAHSLFAINFVFATIVFRSEARTPMSLVLGISLALALFVAVFLRSRHIIIYRRALRGQSL